MEEVPDGILHNILARLPAKPLLRSRCVSKRWNNLISDPYFMKMRSCRKTLLVSPPLYILDGSVPVDNLAHPPGRLLHDPNVRCMMSRFIDQLILYNPFTGASKQLHDPYFASSYNYEHLYGFCHGETLDDLMIVRFRDYSLPPNHNWKTCDVLNLKTNLWRTSEILIQDADFRGRGRGEIGRFANGFLYWIAYKKIVALNVREMVISEISRPAVTYEMDSIFGTLHGCLCMITLNSNDYELDVWVMKEHDVKNPWSIVHSIQLPFQVYELFHTMDDGLLEDGSHKIIICMPSRVLVRHYSSRLSAWDDTIDKLKAHLSKWKMKTL
nr:hypothetical protein [Tanacetum cinerariifolium]